QPHQVRPGIRPLPHDPAILALSRREQREYLDSSWRQGHRLRWERFLLRRHDALERRVARLVQALLGRQHGGEGELDHLDPALNLALGGPRPGRQLEVRHRGDAGKDRKSTRLNSSHVSISYAVFCLKKTTKLV